MLQGRGSECEQLDRLLEAVRAGLSRALVVRGEAGVGKTALLEHLAEKARGFHVSRITGVQSEMELAFAGLHQLCAPMSDRLPYLPDLQRDALQAALGLGSGPAPDGFLVALAALGLLGEAARERPLLCLVDDVQWLDRASMQALAFAARRLQAESVAIIFAARTPDEWSDGSLEPTGLPELLVEGLPDADARALLHSVLPGSWDEQVLDRIIAEARGNPLALLELPKGSTPVAFAGGFGMPDARAITGRLWQIYAERIALLPLETRRLLLAAAAEPSGDPILLWRAAEQLGIGVDAAAPAIAAGLVQISDRVRFHHPLVRSGVYWTASSADRRGAHHALAEVTDPEVDPDRHAWHAAHGASGADERVAVMLERSADRARGRGGLAAAAAFMARSVELTLDPARRRQRALAAAQASHQVGSPDAALRLLSIAEAGPLDQFQRGEADLLRAQIAYTIERGSDAPGLLLKAARQFESYDMARARETYLEAISAAMFTGSLAGGVGQLEAAEAARLAPSAALHARPVDLLLDGTVARLLDGPAAGVPMLKPAVNAFCGSDISEEEGLRWLWMAGVTAVYLWDHRSWDVLSARYLKLARESGQVTTLPLALTMRIAAQVLAGELSAAASLAEEVRTVSEAVGIPTPSYGALLVTAWQGHESACTDLARATVAEATRRGEGNVAVGRRWAMTLLWNSLGRYKDALAAADQALDPHHPTEIGLHTWTLVEGIEAAARSGALGHAAEILQRMIELTSPSGTDWAMGIEARSRALVSVAAAAEGHYREAIDRLSCTPVRGELARAHLLYGEWLRRGRRRQAAREQLRTAHELFTAMGMEAFAERAARELVAIGVNVSRRTAKIASELTAQEAQIVRLVREGRTNPEIATQLFISPRTVEWHLGKIFGKLGVTSRRQLQRSSHGGSS
ncbi:AAA family ATPase [Nonomuraea sp. H19]|uniref:helix-turn-helix transcriptional regulator n=1 Tax=Nonomuraea sp. H19 TaxID=3452206 RepID=UPI003F8AC2D9